MFYVEHKSVPPVVKKKIQMIHPSMIYITYLLGVAGKLEPISADYG